MADTLDRRFALIGYPEETSVQVRYPYKKLQKQTGRYGYACTLSGERDRHGGGTYESDISAVIRCVVTDKGKVRAKEDKSAVPIGSRVQDGSIGLTKNFPDYWVAPELLHLVANAETRPLDAIPTAAITKHITPATPLTQEEARAEINADQRYQGMSVTERKVYVDARIGQGDYRKRMLQIWHSRCALTGLELEPVLIASHAKPWKDATNQERLDAYNGLLLAATIDRLFDRGLIAFSDSGKLLIGPGITQHDLHILGVKEGAHLGNGFDPRHKPYLQAHRRLHGFA